MGRNGNWFSRWIWISSVGILWMPASAFSEGGYLLKLPDDQLTHSREKIKLYESQVSKLQGQQRLLEKRLEKETARLIQSQATLSSVRRALAVARERQSRGGQNLGGKSEQDLGVLSFRAAEIEEDIFQSVLLVSALEEDIKGKYQELAVMLDQVEKWTRRNNQAGQALEDSKIAIQLAAGYSQAGGSRGDGCLRSHPSVLGSTAQNSLADAQKVVRCAAAGSPSGASCARSSELKSDFVGGQADLNLGSIHTPARTGTRTEHPWLAELENLKSEEKALRPRRNELTVLAPPVNSENPEVRRRQQEVRDRYDARHPELARYADLQVQVGRKLNQIALDPNALNQFVLRSQVRSEQIERLDEVIQQSEGVGPLAQLSAIARMYDVSPNAAFNRFLDKSPKESPSALTERIRPLPDRAQQVLLRIHAESALPKARERREILQNSAVSLFTGSDVRPGSASPTGWLRAEEGQLHYDLLQRNLNQQAWMSPTVYAAKTEGRLNEESFKTIASEAGSQLQQGKSLATVVVGSGSHWVTLVLDKAHRKVTTLDPMGESSFFNPDQQRQIARWLEPAFGGTGSLVTELIPTRQQKDSHNCMIFSLLNAHQIAKRADREAYQEVTASLDRGALRTYDDIQRIGERGERRRIPGEGYDQSRYLEFMNSFRAKTLELGRQWQE